MIAQAVAAAVAVAEWLQSTRIPFVLHSSESAGFNYYLHLISHSKCVVILPAPAPAPLFPYPPTTVAYTSFLCLLPVPLSCSYPVIYGTLQAVIKFALRYMRRMRNFCVCLLRSS